MMKWLLDNRQWVFSGIGVAIIAVLLPSIYKWHRNLRAPFVADYWRRRKRAVDAAVDRINREAKNLKRIAEGAGYSGDAHRRAVEVSSFELLHSDLSPLATYWRYQRLVRSILAEISKIQAATTKSVARLQPLIDRLHRRLRADKCHVLGA